MSGFLLFRISTGGTWVCERVSTASMSSTGPAVAVDGSIYTRLAHNGHLVQVSAGALYDISALANGPGIIGLPTPTAGSVYARGEDGHLWQFYFNAAGAGSWEPWDISALASGPDIAGRPATVPKGVYARGEDGHLWQFYFNPAGSWEPWDVTALSNGPGIAGNPVAEPGTVFARGDDGHLWQYYFTPAGAGSWEAWDISALAKGPGIVGDPAVGPGGVFAQGENGHLWQFHFNPSRIWEPWDLTAIALQADSHLRIGTEASPAIGGKAPHQGIIISGTLVRIADPPPPPPPKVRVPAVVGSIGDVAEHEIHAVGLKPKVINTTGEPEHQKLVVASQVPDAGTMVDPGSEVEITLAVPATPVRGPSAVGVLNRSNEQVDLEIWMWDYTAQSWADKGSAPYNGGVMTIALPDGHVIGLTAVNPYAAGCSSEHPTEYACDYAWTTPPVTGDPKGSVAPWIIT